MKMVHRLLLFLQRPVYERDNSLNLNDKLILLFQLLGLSLLISLGIGLLISILEKISQFNFGRHALELLFEQYSSTFIFIVAVIFAPVVEELIFRAPMYLFRNSRLFGIVFYLLTLTFGFYHLSNFEMSATVLYLSPLLVAPQLFIGLLLGYLRVRAGLIWTILLHALYNLILIGPIVMLKALDIPTQ